MSRFIVEPALNAAKRVLSQTALDISAATSGRRYPYRLISQRNRPALQLLASYQCRVLRELRRYWLEHDIHVAIHRLCQL